MEALAAMKRLREIRAQEDSYDAFGVEDAEWMVEHWPQLRVVGENGFVEDVFRWRWVRRILRVRCVVVDEDFSRDLIIKNNRVLDWTYAQ